MAANRGVVSALRVSMLAMLCSAAVTIAALPTPAKEGAEQGLVFLPLELDGSYDDMAQALAREGDLGYQTVTNYFTAIPMRLNFEVGSGSLRWLCFNWHPRYARFLDWAQTYEHERVDGYLQGGEAVSLAVYDVEAIVHWASSFEPADNLTAVLYEVSADQLFAMVAVPINVLEAEHAEWSLPTPQGNIILIISQYEGSIYGLCNRDAPGEYRTVLRSRRGGRKSTDLYEPGFFCAQASGSYFSETIVPMLINTANTGYRGFGHTTWQPLEGGHHPMTSYLRDTDSPFEAWTYPAKGTGREVLKLDEQGLRIELASVGDANLMVFTLRDGTTAIIVFE